MAESKKQVKATVDSKAAKEVKESLEQQGLADAPTEKKIGFFSAMLIAMGSSIGAGIFFKAKGVLEATSGSLVMAIFAWLIAAFAVICMALALVEVSSGRNDNLGLIGWCKTFNSRMVYKSSKNFMAYIYLPLTYFFMPLYVIQSIMDAVPAFGADPVFGAGDADWVIWLIISLAISAFFIFVSGLSSKAGNIMNKAILGVKFIPLAATIILGFVIAGWSGYGTNVAAEPQINGGDISSSWNPYDFGNATGGIGIFMAVGAIFFAYDGFYVTAGMQTEMKEPKKTPIAIVLGLGAVTIIYLLIAISMSLGGNGGLFGFYDFLEDQKCLWVFGVLNLLIAIGVMGIINGFAMWAPRFVEDLLKEGELPFADKYMNKLNDHKPMVGVLYCVVISAPIVIIFTIVGALAYYNNYGLDYQTKQMGSLLTFCDLMGTWTAVFAFMFIMLPIAGCLKNRKTNKVQTEQKKYFVWSAWVAVIVISIVLVLLFVDAFFNVFVLINIAQPGWKDATAALEYNAKDLVNVKGEKITEDLTGGLTAVAASNAGVVGASLMESMAAKLGFDNTAAMVAANTGFDATKHIVQVSNLDYYIGGTDGIVGRVMKLVMLLVFVALMILPTVIEDAINKKKGLPLDKEVNVAVANN